VLCRLALKKTSSSLLNLGSSTIAGPTIGEALRLAPASVNALTNGADVNRRSNRLAVILRCEPCVFTTDRWVMSATINGI
jgi:hypothetical protein